MSLQDEILADMKSQGVDLVRFVDISQLSGKQTKYFKNAILIGILLSPEFIKKVSDTPAYVKKMISDNLIKKDEFHLTELKTDKLADKLAKYLWSKGYKAYSQSEKNIDATACYNLAEKSTPLPHKTIAGLAGIGWIGKHNLLVSPEFGSAFSMCTVLTDAPLETVLHNPTKSQCGTCTVCQKICLPGAIVGKQWEKGGSRDDRIDVFKCTTCMECLAVCPWTQKYMRKYL